MMTTTKQAVNQVLSALPDDVTIEGVMEALYVRSQIEHALKQEEDGEVIEHEEMEKKMDKWTNPS